MRSLCVYVYLSQEETFTIHYFQYTTEMDKTAATIIVYTILLVVPSSLCREIASRSEEKRQVQALAPIASYAGLVVAPEVYLALAAAYGISQLYRYAISECQLKYSFMLLKIENKVPVFIHCYD